MERSGCPCRGQPAGRRSFPTSRRRTHPTGTAAADWALQRRIGHVADPSGAIDLGLTGDGVDQRRAAGGRQDLHLDCAPPVDEAVAARGECHLVELDLDDRAEEAVESIGQLRDQTVERDRLTTKGQ